MENLINQAFAHVEGLAEPVFAGRYDLIGPDKEIIMPMYWESTIEPDMHITMMLWPIPEPKKEDEIPIPPDGGSDGILILDDLMSQAGGGSKKKGMAKLDIILIHMLIILGNGKKKKPGALGMWMLGGAPSRSGRSLKGDKKPDVAAGSQHGATEQQGACIVM
jgi:hypothetical protein